MNQYKSRKLKGTALAYGLVIMTVVSIIMTSMITFVAQQTKLSLRIVSREQAFHISETGIQFYRWYLAHQVDGRTAGQVADFWATGNPIGVATPYEVEYVDSGGAATGKYRLTVTPPASGNTAVTVIAEGWSYRYPNDIRTIEVRFRKPAWSENAFVLNDFNRFGEGTEVFGRIHSNQGIRFDGLAHNLVTSSVSTYNDPDHTGSNEFGVHTHKTTTDPLPPTAVPNRTDVFEAGRRFPVATADFNGILGDLSYMKSQAQAAVNGSRYFNNADQGRHIILKTDGTYDIRTVRSFSAGTNAINQYRGNWSNYTIPNDGVIFVENNVWLEGTVSNKRVVIAAANMSSGAAKSVYIGKDIRYTNYNTCTDMIGIVAQDDVEIYKASEDDLRIDAALVAQSGRVGRQNYQGGTDVTKTVITLFGAVVSNERYGFAWIDNSGNHAGGYITRNIYYDNNLLYCPPPYFPTGTEYEQDLWREQ
jgi:hypothetical protein